jgi:predicted MFS family arabinose efflux permease
MAIMPTLIGESRLTSANALYANAVQIGSMLGPVLGGVLVAATGPTPAFALDAGSFLLSAASVALIRGTRGRPAATAQADAAAVAAPSGASAGPATDSLWGLLRRSPVLQIILVVSVTANLAITGTTEVALPALAHARFGADGYGAVLACFAVTSIAGALLVARVGDRYRPALLIAGSFLAAAAGIAAAPFLGGLPGVAAGMAVFGLAIGVDQVVSVTLIQRWAPPAMLGRVWGLLILATTVAFPLATFAAGLLTGHLGPTPVFPIAGALLALAILYGLSRREFRDFGTASTG